MKYAIIILGGAAADAPSEALAGRTPLEAAIAPHLADIARSGRVGAVETTPGGLNPSVETSCAELLGVDPVAAQLSRAALEAVALGLDTGAPTDTFLSLSFVTIGDESDRDDAGVLLDPSVPGLTRAESALLMQDLLKAWRAAEPDAAQHLSAAQRSSGAGFVLVDRSGRSYENLRTTPPAAAPRAPWRKLAPVGPAPAAELLTRLMDIGLDVLLDHEVNRARRDSGMRPANMAWIWGPGRRPSLPDFAEQHGLRAAIVTRDDAVAGLARCMNWDRVPLPTPPEHSDPDADLAPIGHAGAGALDRYDLVCIHAPLHSQDPAAAQAAIERADAEIVAPVLARLRARGDAEAAPAFDTEIGWRILVACDHAPPPGARAHAAQPAPFAMAGAWVRSVIQRPLTEKSAAESDLLVDPGHDLLEYFLFGGMKHLRPRPEKRARRRTTAAPSANNAKDADGDTP